MSVLGVTIGNTDGNIIDSWCSVFCMVCQPSGTWCQWCGNLVCRLLRHLPFRYHPLQLKTPGRDSEVASSIEKAVAGRRVNQVTTFRQSSKP